MRIYLVTMFEREQERALTKCGYRNRLLNYYSIGRAGHLLPLYIKRGSRYRGRKDNGT